MSSGLAAKMLGCREEEEERRGEERRGERRERGKRGRGSGKG